MFKQNPSPGGDIYPDTGGKRLTDCEQELAMVRQRIDTRTVKAIAKFAKAHGLHIEWPNKNNAGAIILPALTIEGAELQKHADAVVTAVHVDEEAGRRDELSAERGRLATLIRVQPDGALDVLLAERRRK